MSRSTKQNETGSLRAGSAQIDITPPLGTHLAGDGAGIYRPGKKVLDPLYAKAVVIESAGRKVAIVTLDVICITDPYTRMIREAARALGFEPEAVMVHSLQNHSAPSVGGLMLDPDFPFTPESGTEYLTGSNEAYCRQAVTGAIASLHAAVEKLTPVEIAYGRGILSNQAFNRRAIGMDGSVHMPWFYEGKTQPLGPIHLRYMEGPDDPEVGVIAFRSPDLTLQAVLLHFSCHPVNLYATRREVISADWPGAWAAALSKQYPAACPFTVLNGCCGNLNPWPPMTPDFKPDHRRMGGNLAKMAAKVLDRMEFSATKTIEWRMRQVPLTYREVPEARRKEVDRILKRHPQPQWNHDRSAVENEWFLAASTKSIDYCRKRMPEFLYEVQVLRVGDAFLVGLSGEPFVEGQLAIKTQSPLPYVQVAHMCSHYTGYLSTLEGARHGGHEANDLYTNWAKLAPDSLDRVVQNVKEMMADLMGGRGKSPRR
jgi:hypothetical protein